MNYWAYFRFIVGFFEYNSGRLKSYVWIILYTAIILWIDGKRYLIVTAVIMFIFFYLNSMYFNKKRIPLKTLLIFGGCCFVIFYIGYTFAYKVNTDIAGIRFDIIYASARIDFGRDDVTKFVLYEELVEK